MVDGQEGRTGKTGTVGIGIPGSLEPQSRLGKGASWIWILGKSMEADIRAAIGRAFEAQFSERTSVSLKAAEIMDMKGAGDHLANLLWRRYVDRVARGLATIVNALDPDVLVMGGGMSNIDELYEDLPRELARRTFSTVFHTPILRNMHGNASGMRGAAHLWKE